MINPDIFDNNVYIFEKANAVFLAHFAKEDIESLTLTHLGDEMRPGDLYQGCVERLEGSRAWVDIGHARPALLTAPNKSLIVGERVCVRIDRVPTSSSVWGQKGAQVTQKSIKLAKGSSKTGKIQAAPEEWLSYLEAQKMPLKVITPSERIFHELKKSPSSHNVVLKSDVKVPPEFSMAWQSLLEPVVRIPGGGWILIEEGETLTAIDVNTSGGEFISSDFKQDRDWLRFNQRAAHVIQSQIKGRQLGGIIVIDFPRLYEKKNQEALYHTMMSLNDQLSWILGFTKGGLFEMTRQKSHDSLPRRLQEIMKKTHIGFLHNR